MNKLGNEQRIKLTIQAAAAVYTVFVVYGSLVPLEFEYVAFSEAWKTFSRIPYLQLDIRSRADWVANGILFFPLSYLWLTALEVSTRVCNRRGILVALAVFFCVLLSAAIEFTQIYFPQRTVSQNDIIAEVIGGLLGAIVWLKTSGKFIRFVYGWALLRQLDNKWHVLLLFYLGILFFYSLMPLDLYLSPIEMYHKWNEGRINLIPFAFAPKAKFLLFYEVVTDIVIWIPVFLLVAYKRYSLIKSWWIIIALAVTIEMLQLFVYSRSTDITDIITAGIGGLVGVYVYKFFFKKNKSNEALTGRGKITYPTMALGVFLVICLLFVYWYPFDFSLDKERIDAALDSFFSVPFKSYYFHSEYRALTILLQKVLFVMPLGAWLGFVIWRCSTANRKAVFYLLCFTSATLVMVAEMGQILLPSKKPDLTDLMLGWVGLFTGYKMFWLYSVNHGVDEAKTVNASLSRTVGLSSLFKTAMIKLSSQLSGRTSFLLYLTPLVFITLLLYMLVGLDSVPYNVKELIAGDYKIFRVAGLVFTGYLVFGVPLVVMSNQLNIKRNTASGVFSANLPMRPVLCVFIHSIVVWVAVRLMLPMESIFDILGSPTWMPMLRELELAIRFLALFLLVSLSIWYAGAVLVSQSYGVKVYHGRFVFIGLFALIVAYFVVIRFANTDNLTELLVKEGRSLKVLLLVVYLTLLIYCGLALRFLFQFKGYKFYLNLLVILISCPFGFWLLNMGLESMIVKYGSVFSAIQFLLSTNRYSYVQPAELFRIFVVTHYFLIFIICCLQTNQVKTFNKSAEI